MHSFVAFKIGLRKRKMQFVTFFYRLYEIYCTVRQLYILINLFTEHFVTIVIYFIYCIYSIYYNAETVISDDIDIRKTE